MTMPTVKTAYDEVRAIDVVVLAFSADPAARWTWPDPQQYLTHFPRFVKAFGGDSVWNSHPLERARVIARGSQNISEFVLYFLPVPVIFSPEGKPIEDSWNQLSRGGAYDNDNRVVR